VYFDQESAKTSSYVATVPRSKRDRARLEREHERLPREKKPLWQGQQCACRGGRVNLGSANSVKKRWRRLKPSKIGRRLTPAFAKPERHHGTVWA